MRLRVITDKLIMDLDEILFVLDNKIHFKNGRLPVAISNDSVKELSRILKQVRSFPKTKNATSI